MRQIAICLLVVTVAATGLAQVNGWDIPGKYGAGALVETQLWCTGYGDSIGYDSPGSEMDQLFLDDDGTQLHLSITGNLEWNGNAYLIFLDTIPGAGQTQLITDGIPGPPYAVNGLHGSTFDGDFAPDFIIAVDTYGGSIYVSHYYLEEGVVGVRTYLGSGYVDSGDGYLYGGDIVTDIQVAFDNTNFDGVYGCPDGSGDPTNVTTGMESLIPYYEIGDPLPGDEIKVWALLSSGSGDGYFSNHALPAFDPDPGDSSPAYCQADLDGDNTVGQGDLGILLGDWGCVGEAPGDCVGDLDGDLTTGQGDLGILLGDWGCVYERGFDFGGPEYGGQQWAPYTLTP